MSKLLLDVDSQDVLAAIVDRRSPIDSWRPKLVSIFFLTNGWTDECTRKKGRNLSESNQSNLRFSWWRWNGISTSSLLRRAYFTIALFITYYPSVNNLVPNVSCRALPSIPQLSPP
jgi:hypothetical protein